MKTRTWLFLIIVCLFFSCGSNTTSDQPQAEKDSIENVGDAASSFGYDGEAIEKGLRNVEGMAEEQDEAVDEIFSE